MSKINLKNAHLHYFKPIVCKRHSLAYKWLIDSGYTVTYLCLCLGIRIEELSGYFREPHKLNLRQANTVILLLRGIKEPNEVIKALMLPIDISDNKLNEDLKQLYDEIVLPVPSRSVPVHRLNYEPKKSKE